MYFRHFALDGPPFRFAPSSAVLYLGSSHRECLAALQWALLHDQCGFMLLIGETGTGKTTLLNAILARRLRNLHLACVTNPRLGFQEIMRVVLPQLGVTTDERGKLELIRHLERVVASRPEGHRTAIVIDEAQGLSDENLEDLRLLANRIGAQDGELQIVLMGHPELLERLSARNLRQLRERISTKVSLLPLSAAESVAYVECRLEAQRGSTRIFEARALRHIVEAAAGIPRRLNVLCHNALLLACSRGERTVTLAVAREVVSDYQSILGAAPAPAARPPLPAMPARSLHRELPLRSLTIEEKRHEAQGQEPAVRPRRRPIYAAAACAVVVVAAVGVLSVPTTQNWADEINRAVPALAGLIRPAEAGVAPKSSSDNKPVAPTVGDTAAIAPALGYTAPIVPAGSTAPVASAPVDAAPRKSTEPASAPDRTTIQIHSGDTFHDLAAKYLGSKDRTWELIRSNPQIRDPNVLYVGETVYLPSTHKNQQARVVR